MTPLFKKLNLKDQKSIFVIDSPASFEAELDLLDDVKIRRRISPRAKVEFVIFFVQTLAAVERASKSLDKATGDPVV